MNSRTTFVLVAVLLICTGYVVYFHTDLFRPAPAEDANKEKPLFGEALGAAKSLEITDGDGKRIVFRKDEFWRIAEPIRAKAEGWKVDQVYDAVKDLKGRAADDVGTDLTGLDKPLWTLTLTDEENVTRTLRVGRPRVLQSEQTYVSPGTTPKAWVVRENFASKLTRPLREYRDKAVLDLDTDKIVRLAVQGRVHYELKKQKDQWGLVSPVSARADKEKVDDILGKVARLRVNEFVADAPADLGVYGLAEGKERLVVRVWLEAPQPATAPATKPARPAEPGKSHALALGRQRGDDVYGRLLGEAGVFRVDKGLLDELQPKLIDVREKKILSAEPPDVVRAELRLPTGQVTLVSKSGAWQMTGPFAGKASNKAVEDLLDKLASLKAADFRDDVSAPERYGLDKPHAEITLHLSGKDRTAGVLVGSRTPSGEMTFVRAVGGKAVGVVATSDVEPLLGPAPGYWDTSLLKLADDARITSVSIERTDGKFRLERDKDDAWRLAEPLAADADAMAVDKIAGHLRDLGATKIIALAGKTPKGYAQAADPITVRFTAELPAPPTPATAPSQPTSGPATAPATPGAPGPATAPATRPAPPKTTSYALRAAKVDRKPCAWVLGRKIVAIGEVDAGVYDDLAAEVRDRKVMGAAGDDVENVRILTGKDVFELRRKNDTWEYTGDRYVKIDEEKVKKYLDEFKELKADKFAAHKTPAAEQVKEFGLDAPQMSVELRPRQGKLARLVVGSAGPGKGLSRYATATGVTGVFVLTDDTIGKLTKGLDDFKK